MENHERYLKLASQYMDSELKGDSLTGFKDHLRNCPVCQREADFCRETRSAITAVEQDSISSGTELLLSDLALEENRNRSILDRFREIIIFHPVQVQLAFQIILIIIGLELGMLSYSPSSGRPAIRNFTAGGAGLFSAVYPGSFTQSYIAMEAPGEK